jgi:hypothetical protein
MNYTRTSMNYLNILPPRIRQLVYDFDGRYKTTKGKCLQIIKEMGQAEQKMEEELGWNIEAKRDINIEDYHSLWPHYYAELERRVTKYRGLLVDGHIRGVTTHIKRLPKLYTFRDALGSYSLGTSYDTVFIDGTAYKSTKKVFTVVMEPISIRLKWLSYIRIGCGTTTVVKCIDILDPLFIKSIKARGKKRAKVFRDLGISENGIPGRDVYFEPITIDGKDYFMENRVMSIGGYIRKTRSSSVLGHINAKGIVNWYGDKR